MIEAVNDVSIVDVRTPKEYFVEHLPNAIKIPLDQITQRSEEFR